MFNVLVPVLSDSAAVRITQIALLDAVADVAASARACANSSRKLAYTKMEIARVQREIRILEGKREVLPGVWFASFFPEIVAAAQRDSADPAVRALGSTRPRMGL